MKSVNLVSISEAHQFLSEDVKIEYNNGLHSIKLKTHELHVLSDFVRKMQLVCADFCVFNNFFIDYKIAQISKQFDLLRIGSDCIVNIELKSQYNDDDIREQLNQNYHYLKTISDTVHLYTYVSSNECLYTLSESNDLIEVEFHSLAEILLNQSSIEFCNLDEHFNPTNFLVSPFNSTQKFVNGDYFLTGHQKEIKKELLTNISTSEPLLFYIIKGNAGTGKSLLIYDFAKEVNTLGWRVLIIHCGNLNPGHNRLRDEFHWEIIPIKSYVHIDFSDYDIVIIDETQRIIPGQLRTIISRIEENNCICVFALDPLQCLKDHETNNNIEEIINNLTNPKVIELTKKIRTNLAVINFIDALFNRNVRLKKIDKENIKVVYFRNLSYALEYIQHLDTQEWKIINYTLSNFNSPPYTSLFISNNDNAHAVIGQEFDNVVAIVDEHFQYTENKLDIPDYSYFYNPVKMLYQIMTRARKRICFIIINNPMILSRCVKILNNQDN